MLYACPMRYEFRYVRGIVRPPGVALVTGTGTHAGVEGDLLNKIRTGELLPEEAVRDITRDAVNREWDKGVELNYDERKEGEKAVRGRAVDQAVSLATLHHRELAPVIEPVAVEKTWMLELEGFPVDLSGTIDVEEKHSFRDTKTYSKMPTQYAVDRSVQFSMYALWKKTVDGQNPGTLHMDVLLKTKEPKAVAIPTTRGEKDYHEVLRRVDSAVKLIESGCFMPTSPDNWQCSRKFCGYFDICEYGARSRTTQYVQLGGD
jgi:CRISPR/Cas system-associated exonuclease Cas4 (RecB family)